MSNALGTFEGRKVIKTTISVRNAGDGLSQAMEVDPQLLHQGDTVYVVMECAVGPVSFDPVKDSDSDCLRKHVLRAGAATIVDADLVKQAVEAQTEKIIASREAAAGIQRVPDDETLRIEHADGFHDASKYIGCPVCYPEGNPNASTGSNALAAKAAKATKAVAKTAKKATKSTAKRAPRKAPAKKK